LVLAALFMLLAPVAALASAASSDAAAAAQIVASDYSKPANWLCRPGEDDACTRDLTTTVIQANGQVSTEGFKANPNPPFDCFYIYPTVSMDKTGNSDMVPDESEKISAWEQFGRFGADCRLYAPMYRQITVPALLSRYTGHSMPQSYDLAFADVKAAWAYYLQHDNHGRGVILIAHSQGSKHLQRLLREVIKDSPARDRMIAAYVIGYPTPVGKDDTYESFPICRSNVQTGCIMTYESFRATVPPPSTSVFGRTQEPGKTVACTNPAAMAGGEAPLHAYLAERTSAAFPPQPVQWLPDFTLKTTFVSVPGLLSAECVQRDGASYLEIRVHGDPADPRTDDIRGDALNNGRVLPKWGLHPIDMHLTMGNLIDLAREEGAAWLARHPGS